MIVVDIWQFLAQAAALAAFVLLAAGIYTFFERMFGSPSGGE